MVMTVELGTWLMLVLWGNLLIMVMVLLSLMSIQRERKKLERVIIAMAENRKKYR